MRSTHFILASAASLASASILQPRQAPVVSAMSTSSRIAAASAIPSSGAISTATATGSSPVTSSTPTNDTTPKCYPFYQIFNVTSNNTFFSIGPTTPAQVSDVLVEFASTSSNSSVHITGTQNITGSYQLYFEYCEPAGGPTKPSVLQLIHGVNFGHKYWSFDFNRTNGTDTQYNFVEAATSAGYATLAYDRLGVGLSQRPTDGVNVTQTATQVALAEAISSGLRNGTLFDNSTYTGNYTNWNSVVAIGHSYGSAQSQAITVSSNATFDAVILTGFSIDSAGVLATLSGLGADFAKNVNASKWSNFSDSYLASGPPANDRFLFFYDSVIGYEEDVFQLAAASKEPFGMGEFFTLSTANGPALSYSGHVLVVTGSNDFISCAGSCYNNGTAIPATVQALYPAAASFETYVPPSTGHAVNLHYSAPQTFVKIVDWLQSKSL